MIKEESHRLFNALNLSIMFMAAAFIIGNYSNISNAAINISNTCGLFCRMNNVITGNVIVERGIANNASSGSAFGAIFLIAFVLISIVLIIKSAREY